MVRGLWADHFRVLRGTYVSPPACVMPLAQAIKRDLGEISPLIPGKLTDRSMEWQLMAQLRGAAAKLRSPAEAEAAAEIIAPLAQEMFEDPQGHLRKMLSRGHYRGTEVRLMAPGEPDNLKMVPYPAHLQSGATRCRSRGRAKTTSPRWRCWRLWPRSDAVRGSWAPRGPGSSMSWTPKWCTTLWQRGGHTASD